ncbi:hypothetical protein [Streptomyces ardesiacus]
MSMLDFWDLFTRGEIYMVRGELVTLRGYMPATGQAVFEDENGKRVVCGRGLIRLVTDY